MKALKIWDFFSIAELRGERMQKTTLADCRRELQLASKVISWRLLLAPKGHVLPVVELRSYCVRLANPGPLPKL
jgi:hypothetical protein